MTSPAFSWPSWAIITQATWAARGTHHGPFCAVPKNLSSPAFVVYILV